MQTLKLSLTMATLAALMLTACGKENPFQETCYQADSGALMCLSGVSNRYSFMAEKSTQRGNIEFTGDRIDFTRTYFNNPLYDLAYEKFSCSYHKEGENLALSCSGSSHMVYQAGLQVQVAITPDGQEVLFKFRNPNFVDGGK